MAAFMLGSSGIFIFIPVGRIELLADPSSAKGKASLGSSRMLFVKDGKLAGQLREGCGIQGFQATHPWVPWFLRSWDEYELIVSSLKVELNAPWHSDFQGRSSM